jgi:crotonobetainyl-CoA:carnitine CoA-transferase CaiB-like acyl-CoA transferase
MCPRPPTPPPCRWVASPRTRYRSPRPDPPRWARRAPSPVYRLFEASDGLWFFIACGTAVFANKLLIAIGHTELAADPIFESTPWGLGTEEARALLVPLLEETFRVENRDHWISVLREYDVPAQPVHSRDEYFDSYTVSANDMRVSIEHPDYEWVEMMGVPLNLTATPCEIHGQAPHLVHRRARAATPPRDARRRRRKYRVAHR